MKTYSAQQVRALLENTRRPISGWPQVVLLLAGFYNIAFGLWTLLAPGHFFRLAGMQAPVYLELWQCVGMVVGLYGVGYIIAASDVVRFWPLVFVGLLGKVFGPMGFLIAYLQDRMPAAAGWLIVTNDLIWLLPFAVILARVFSRSVPLPRKLSATEESSLAELERIHAATAAGNTLIVFIRHLGCIFCHQWLQALTNEKDRISRTGTKLILVHMGPEAKLRNALEEYDLHPELCVQDSERILYRAFGIPLVAPVKFLFPSTVRSAFREMLESRRGNGLVYGDGFQGAGLVGVRQGAVSFRQIPAVAHELPAIDDALAALEGEGEALVKLKLFYDGGCPMCNREIRWIRQYTGNSVEYIDIDSASFDPEQYHPGASQSFFMQEIRALRSDGTLISGVAAFRELYRAAGMGWVWHPSTWPLVGNLVERLYRVFARWRYCRRMGSVCSIPK